MLSCRQATRLVSTSLDRRLTTWERVLLNIHMVICIACRAYRRQVQGLDAAFKAYFRHERATTAATDDTARAAHAPPTGQPGLPDAAKDRIKAAMRENRP